MLEPRIVGRRKDRRLFTAREAVHADDDRIAALYPQLERYARAHHGRRANGADAYIDFINWMDKLVRSRGRTLRVWNGEVDRNLAEVVDTILAALEERL